MKRLTQGLADLAGVAIAAMILLTVADVLMKNVLNRPIVGAFELVELLLVLAVFFGMAEVFRANGNIQVDVIDHFVGARARARLQSFGATCALLFLLLLGAAMLAPALDTVTFPQSTQEIGIPLYLYWAPILAGTALAIIAALRATWSHLRARAIGGER